MTPARQSHYDRITDLEAEVAWLRAELGFRKSVAHEIKQAFNLFPMRAAILAALYAANGRWVLARSLEEFCRTRQANRPWACLHVHVTCLRHLFGKDLIQTSGKGEDHAVRILPPVIARIEAALTAAQ